eukprot:scaffold40867_cov65-Cyclotella_meneghiniana.AAC.2
MSLTPYLSSTIQYQYCRVRPKFKPKVQEPRNLQSLAQARYQKYLPYASAAIRSVIDDVQHKNIYSDVLIVIFVLHRNTPEISLNECC